MFTFNFSSTMEITDYTFTVKLGNQIINKQTVSMPDIIAQENFMQLTEQISRDQNPMQVKCAKVEYTDKGRQLKQFLSFSNNDYVRAFEDEFKD